MNKAHILEEIVRTAKENSGIPLGRGRFTKETGIRVQDWEGKYWTKWSDAVIEAGYTPNKMQSAYDEDWLIKQIISFIREIRKFPTVQEFKLKAYDNPGFPSKNTIREHFGKQYQLAIIISNYCQSHPEFSDVIDFCNDIPRPSEKETSYYPIEPELDYGYVYLMKSGRFYKIGCSKNVERRNYDLGIKLPESLEILHKIKTEDPTGIENYWHNRFKDKRKQGEWFELSNSDISAFKRRKFM